MYSPTVEIERRQKMKKSLQQSKSLTKFQNSELSEDSIHSLISKNEILKKQDSLRMNSIDS